jgi:hypothetical protein
MHDVDLIDGGRGDDDIYIYIYIYSGGGIIPTGDIQKINK